MKITKTVTGIYVLDEGDVIESVTFSNPAEDLLEEHEIEQQYDAEEVVLPLEQLVEIAGKSADELRRLQVETAKEVTRQRLKASGDRDQLLIQAVRALDDLNEMNNEKSERLRPWFSLHFPELEEEIDSNEELAALVAEQANREEIEEHEELAAESTGMPITEEDAEMLQRFAAHLDHEYTLRDDLEEYVDQTASKVVPNLTAVLGGLLAARLLSLAGSLENLAKMPASTIQVLGAEKAMFRHMRGEGSAPKHGVLFMHEHVQNIPSGKSGDMARFIANKAAIAARLDQYGGDFKGDSLREEVDERFEELK